MIERRKTWKRKCNSISVLFCCCVVALSCKSNNDQSVSVDAQQIGSETTTNNQLIRLTTNNYKQSTNGKSVFLLFWDRSCSICKDILKPTWERLAEEWNSHPIGLVAEINCSHPRGKVICERFKVETAPTILYGDPLAPQEYHGGYDYTSLSQFAKEHLDHPICHVQHLDACDETSKSTIAALHVKSKDVLLAEKQAIDATMDHAWANTFSMTDYNAFVTTTERDFNYKWLQQVLLVDYKVPLEESRFIWPEDLIEPDDSEFDVNEDELEDDDDEFLEEEEDEPDEESHGFDYEDDDFVGDDGGDEDDDDDVDDSFFDNVLDKQAVGDEL
ncbi:hypothetical protein MPSEU_000800400 [Mayamaea pseudoterrestris]|nr:hypothetical protein MPSEU_000800400 [Mayamaea pseudoterrestris]